MIEKLIEEVEVTTIQVNVRCPNPNCEGKLAADGMSRAKNGVHGGALEHRHACAACGAGYWLPEVYPRLKYVPVAKVEKAAAAKLPIKRVVDAGHVPDLV